MPSHDFDRFLESCFDNSFGVVRDGLDQQAVLNLRDDERLEAERLLLQALGTKKDTYSRPIIALVLLDSKQAIEPLKKRLVNAVGEDRLQIALALFRIEKFPEAGKIIIECLRVTDTNKPDEWTRLSAVECLESLGKTRQAVQALLEAMAENNLVGYSAARKLRTLFIEDEPVRNLLGQILLVVHDIHNPDFVDRRILVKQVGELISSRLNK
jgi:HEAT repeat protein